MTRSRTLSGTATRRRLALGATTAMVGALLTTFATSAPAQAAPTYLETLAGPSEAAMYPSGGEYDAVNNRLVIADTGRDRILFYSLAGAKQGEFGTHGAGNGQLASPRDTAIDEAGNIYVADAENNRIQKFTATGAFVWERGGIGQGDETLNTPIGVTWDAANDVLLVASTGQSLIKAWNANGVFQWKSPTGTALGANAPRDVSRGPDGRMYVTAYKQHQIKVYDVSADGKTWNTTPVFVLGDGQLNGGGDNQLNFPYNVVWSADGNTVYVSDTGNGRVARWDLSGATPRWLPPFGGRCDEHPQPCADPPTDAGQFNHLRRVAIDGAGRIYGMDFWGAGIEVFNATGGVATSIEGDEPPVPGFSEAYNVDVAPNGDIYVMDRLNHRIQRFSADGTYVNKVGARGTQPATFSWPEALTVAPNGRVWAVDTRGDRIEDFPANLATTPRVQSYGRTGAAVGQFNYPEGADVGADGVVYVADTRNNRIQKFDPATGTFSVLGGEALRQPMGVAVTGNAVFVADTGSNRVVKLSLSGVLQGSFSTGLNGPEGLEVAPDGTVWVADTQNNRLVHLSAGLADLGDGFGSKGAGNNQFNLPHDLAFGNDKMYVADTYNSRVQVFDATGGTTEPPPMAGGDFRWVTDIDRAGGRAPVYPAGVAVASNRKWFVADSGGSRVVSIDPTTDAITPVASTGLTDPRDLELNPAGTNLFVTDTGGNRVVRMRTSGEVLDSIGGLTQPYGLANDTDRLYVANTYAHQVRAYTKSSNALAWTQTTCEGVRFSRPRDVGVAGNGRVLVADTDNDRIVVLNQSTGACVSAFGTRGTGPGQFKSPRSVASDGGTGVWVADALNYRIQRLTMAGASRGATPVDAYGPGPNKFRSPHCVTQVPGTNRVAVCDTFNYRISVYRGTNPPVRADIVAGTKPAIGGFNGPFGVAYGPAGELYVADWFNHRIQKFNADGTVRWQIGGYGPKPGSFIFPRNVLVAPNGDLVVTDSENNRIDVLNSGTGAFIRSIKPAGAALSRPHQVALDGSGGYWIADTNNSKVVHITSTGQIVSGQSWTVQTGGRLGKPQGIAVDTDGTILVSNTNNNRVERYSASGVLQETLLGATGVTRPGGLALVGTGTARRLYVTDTGGNRVILLTPNGTVATTFGSSGSGNGQFSTPRGVAVSTTGRVAVADFDNNRISVWRPVTTATAGDQELAGADTIVHEPGPNSIVDSDVSFTGSASAGAGVKEVRVAVKNRDTGLWLQDDGTWSSRGSAFRTAQLASPGEPLSTWSLTLPLPSGRYGASVKSVDTAGVFDATPVWRTFTVR